MAETTCSESNESLGVLAPGLGVWVSVKRKWPRPCWLSFFALPARPGKDPGWGDGGTLRVVQSADPHAFAQKGPYVLVPSL